MSDINQVCLIHSGNKFQEGTRCGLCVDEACTFWYSDCCDAKCEDESTLTVVEPPVTPEGTGTCSKCGKEDVGHWIAVDVDLAEQVASLPIRVGTVTSGFGKDILKRISSNEAS